jgi:DNA-binding FadR family transcriptional regulator
LSQQVVEQLARSIVTQQLAPGALLPSEEQLALQLGVSRMVIRESVRVLAALGLVTVQHGVGTYVSTAESWQVEKPITLLLHADQQSLLDWLEIRMLLETSFAKLAAQRAGSDSLGAMGRAIEQMRAAVDSPDTVIEMDFAFHEELARATANSLAVTLMRPILQPLRNHLRAAAQLPNAANQAVVEHETIHAAIVARDSEAAAAAVQNHLCRVIDEIRALHSRQEMPTI